jgi:uncharacterized membrane protein
VAASCFLFDPLVLYNSAVYGRFDSIASALLLSYVGALLGSKRTTVKAALSYGLAVAAKTYPILAIVAVCRVAGRRTWLIAAAVAGCSVLLLLPYIAAPRPLVHDVVLYDLSREAQGLSPQLAVLAYTGQHARTVVGVGSAVVFAVGVVVLAVRLGKDVTAQVTAAVMLFIVTSTLVLEQYLTWPLPLLILLAFRGRHADRPSLLAAGALTVLGLLDSESFHPLGRSSAVIGGLVGAVGLAWLVACVSRPRRTGG